MKVIAINGSPRKQWNTAMMLEKALEGARSKGAETEMIHLQDLDFKGCYSCFACKIKGVTVEKCVVPDGLSDTLQKIKDCDAFLIGSPIYLGEVTGQTRCLLERLVFPYLSYDNQPSSFGKSTPNGFIYTMNCPEEEVQRFGYAEKFKGTAGLLSAFIGPSEFIYATETYQFEDYSKYAAGRFDVEMRKERRETVFVEDLQRAFDLGAKLVG